MSLIAIRGLLRRRRRRLALIVVLVALATTIVVHHDAMSTSGMDHGMGAEMAMCLGVFTAVGAAVVAVAIGVLALDRRRPRLTVATGAQPVARVAPARARDGPALVVLCVCRR